jgi:5-oxopent-3-ene-1,2,5-tricarboxylate decarboxylase/2-hydroxyhepta-2,4-diene-1,7-dioate isomerase
VNLPVWIDGQPAHDGTPPAYTRDVAQLVADVSAFMTLQPGDLLLLGPAANAPVAHAGQQISIDAGALGRLNFSLVDEADAPPPGAMQPPGLQRLGAPSSAGGAA